MEAGLAARNISSPAAGSAYQHPSDSVPSSARPTREADALTPIDANSDVSRRTITNWYIGMRFECRVIEAKRSAKSFPLRESNRTRPSTLRPNAPLCYRAAWRRCTQHPSARIASMSSLTDALSVSE
jgi:hypothetical protein